MAGYLASPLDGEDGEIEWDLTLPYQSRPSSLALIKLFDLPLQLIISACGDAKVNNLPHDQMRPLRHVVLGMGYLSPQSAGTSVHFEPSTFLRQWIHAAAGHMRSNRSLVPRSFQSTQEQLWPIEKSITPVTPRMGLNQQMAKALSRHPTYLAQGPGLRAPHHGGALVSGLHTPGDRCLLRLLPSYHEKPVVKPAR